MKTINVGIIGLGNQGKMSLQNSLTLRGAKVLGVADVSKKALNYARNRGVKNAYTNYEDLLKLDALDSVIVNLPNFLHYEAAVKASEAGKHILMEKPMGRNVEEGKKILSTVRKNDVKLMIGYDLRFNPLLRQVRNSIADGLFGSVKVVDATNVSGGPFSPRSDSVGPVPVPSWWLSKELTGGGVLLDLGSHMIDLLIWYFGDAVCVESFLEHMFKMEIEDVATCLLKFKEGPIACVKVGWFSQDFLQSLQICGTSKNMLYKLAPQSTWKIVSKGISNKIGIERGSSNYLKLEHFVECLQRDEQPQPSGEEGLRSLQVISSAYEKAVILN
jgi:predicted dehydrogenase